MACQMLHTDRRFANPFATVDPSSPPLSSMGGSLPAMPFPEPFWGHPTGLSPATEYDTSFSDIQIPPFVPASEVFTAPTLVTSDIRRPSGVPQVPIGLQPQQHTWVARQPDLDMMSNSQKSEKQLVFLNYSNPTVDATKVANKRVVSRFAMLNRTRPARRSDIAYPPSTLSTSPTSESFPWPSLLSGHLNSTEPRSWSDYETFGTSSIGLQAGGNSDTGSHSTATWPFSHSHTDGPRNDDLSYQGSAQELSNPQKDGDLTQPRFRCYMSGCYNKTQYKTLSRLRRHILLKHSASASSTHNSHGKGPQIVSEIGTEDSQSVSLNDRREDITSTMFESPKQYLSVPPSRPLKRAASTEFPPDLSPGRYPLEELIHRQSHSETDGGTNYLDRSDHISPSTPGLSSESGDLSDEISLAESPSPTEVGDVRQHMVLPDLSSVNDDQHLYIWLLECMRLVTHPQLQSCFPMDEMAGVYATLVNPNLTTTSSDTNLEPTKSTQPRQSSNQRKRSRTVTRSSSPDLASVRPSKSKKLDEDRPFACPFHQRAPLAYCTKGPHGDFRTCASPGFNGIQRVKEHILKCHLQPDYCVLCGASFSSDSEVTTHLQQRNCPGIQSALGAVQLPRHTGLNKDQERELRKKKRIGKSGKSEESDVAHWHRMDKICHPDRADSRSPYYTNWLHLFSRMFGTLLDPASSNPWHTASRDPEAAAHFPSTITDQTAREESIFSSILRRSVSSLTRQDRQLGARHVADVLLRSMSNQLQTELLRHLGGTQRDARPSPAVSRTGYGDSWPRSSTAHEDVYGMAAAGWDVPTLHLSSPPPEGSQGRGMAQPRAGAAFVAANQQQDAWTAAEQGFIDWSSFSDPSFSLQGMQSGGGDSGDTSI